jgi:hypothetical protein
MTPVGAPSFASVNRHEAEASMPPNAMPTGAGQAASTPPVSPSVDKCTKCGGTSGACACGTSDATVTAAKSFTASKLDAGNALTIRQAKAQLENHYEGFRVARIKRDGDAIHARMERTAGPRWDAFKDKARGVMPGANPQENPAAMNPVTRGQAQAENAVYQQQFDQDFADQAWQRQKTLQKFDPTYNMDHHDQAYENEKDQEFTNENYKLPYPGADDYSNEYF